MQRETRSTNEGMLSVSRDSQGHRAALVLAWLALIGVPLWSPADRAVAESSINARDVVTRGSVEAGGAIGYWQDTTAIGSAQSANRSGVFVLPRIGMVLTDPLGSGWWQGNIAVSVEPLFARFVKPSGADAAGGSLLVKYNFLSFGRWMPFWDGGAGVIWTDFVVPKISEETSKSEFVLETGPGVQYFVTKSFAITMGVRFLHISNAGLGERNTGLNGFLPYGGLSWYFPTSWGASSR